MNHTRHSNIFTVPPYFRVHIAGAGGLGAITALTLAKMGVQLMTVSDPDRISEENPATQLYPPSDVGMFKVYSLKNTLEVFSDDILCQPVQAPVTEDTVMHNQHLVIAAVDSIAARQQIWMAATRASGVDFFLDMRMAAEEYQHYFVDMHDLQGVERYHAALYSLDDSMIPEESCTSKATFFTADFAAGHAGKVLRDIVRREAQPHRLIHYIAPDSPFEQKIRILPL